MRPTTQTQALFLIVIAAITITSCDGPWNNPYSADEDGQSVYYVAYLTPPKHLDPAQSYFSHELEMLGNIYEAPLDYHYLKRPYALIPLTATTIPKPVYFDKENKLLPGDPSGDDVHRAQYNVQVRADIKYQPHPCFAKNADGSLRYETVAEADLKNVNSISDFDAFGTRTVHASDYVTQICRLADPRVNSPIYSTMKQYIVGFEQYREALIQQIETLKKERAAEIGLDDASKLDPRTHPILVDYLSIPFPGAKVINQHTYRITLKKKYPQMRYWLGMHFFTSIPPEALAFYAQAPMIARDITLDRYPVGTGPYRIERNVPELEVVMVKNENYHKDLYPSEGEPSDREAGLLNDAGNQMPFIDRIVWKLEKEDMPRWNKFTQGYYDHFQKMPGATIEQAVQMAGGATDVSPEMKAKGIVLARDIEFELWEYAFNMQDEVVGGLEPKKQKLRQAIAIAIDSEEHISIFKSGRAVPGHGPIPPGIFGAIDPTKKPNPFVYNHDKETGKVSRKSMAEAKQLLVEAGYPNGIGTDGKPLEISFDNSFNSPSQMAQIIWLQKRFQLLGITLNSKMTNHNAYRDKLSNGNYQLIMSGWSLDYPDPENFLFLLYSPNGKTEFGGENVANYKNPKADALFLKMESMEDGPPRQKVIDELVHIVQEDAPWTFLYHEEAYELRHKWIANAKTMLVSRNIFKYRRVDPALRDISRKAWNKPVLWPVALLAVAMILLVIPAMRVVSRKR